ncbi:uncharacterized protein LOC144438690 [Glandiceps talaboti]
MKRVLQLKRRFRRNQKYKEDYFSFMEDILQNCAEKVPEDQQYTNGRVNYVPHTGVYHPKKPDKIRVVFDCSARYEGISLNDCLLQGPDLTNGLVGVLSRFRKEEVAVMADIKGMFHQFHVTPIDRDLLRFLWWEDGDLNKDLTEYRMTVHLFGAASSPGCANFGLKRAADDGEEEFGEEAASFIRDDFYVDDGLKSVPDVSKAIELVNNSTAICNNAGLKLHKWISNKREVLDAIPTEARASSLKEVNLQTDLLPIERALGVTWCVESDCFQFRIVLRDLPLTRRGVLATISSVYDPLGFAAPVILTGKVILQELCRDNVDWDDPIPENLRLKWMEWRTNILDLEHLEVERCYKPNIFGEVKGAELHYFSDASETGYGQSTYLRSINQDNQAHCSFVIGKARVTPLKKHITIPRLELSTAAVVSARMSDYIKKELQINDVKEYFWVDSKVVLGYINNESKRFHTYVANRVQQIRELTTPDAWKYVNTGLNPSDDASRGITAKQLVEESKWLTGPDFLWESDFLPTAAASYEFDGATEAEMSKEMKGTAHTVMKTDSRVIQPYDQLLNRFDRYSSWNKVRRAAANCLRLKAKMLRATKTLNRQIELKDIMTEPNTPMTVQDLQEGEKAVIKEVQSIAFQKEIAVLKDMERTGYFQGRKQRRARNIQLQKSSTISKLNPFLDEKGLLRVGGRLQRSNQPFEINHPVILPKKCHITTLIVRHYHEKTNHMGRSCTHNHIRQHGYWIVNGSSVVSRVIHECVVCKRLRGACETQRMGDLPKDRMEEAPPFTYSGVDLFGPFLIKERRSELKRYGVLFVCLTSRAIHLETANSLETDSFINSVRRFLSIRGPTRHIRADCGTNIVGANNEMIRALKEMDQEKIANFLLSQQCDWIEFKFNVPSSSHMGGIWERQIRTVRSVLEPLIHQAGPQLDDESLRTFMAEVQNIVNSRPVTIDQLSEAGAPEPLTPNHLLTMKTKVLLPPPGNFQKGDMYCKRRWRRVQHLANVFWERWRKEFLHTLQPRPKWTAAKYNLQVGDIVIIKDDNIPRNHWRLGRVTDIYPGEDGLVRKVQLTTASSVLDRPIHKLVRLVAADRDKE